MDFINLQKGDVTEICNYLFANLHGIESSSIELKEFIVQLRLQAIGTNEELLQSQAHTIRLGIASKLGMSQNALLVKADVSAPAPPRNPSPQHPPPAPAFPPGRRILWTEEGK